MFYFLSPIYVLSEFTKKIIKCQYMIQQIVCHHEVNYLHKKIKFHFPYVICKVI